LKILVFYWTLWFQKEKKNEKINVKTNSFFAQNLKGLILMAIGMPPEG